MKPNPKIVLIFQDGGLTTEALVGIIVGVIVLVILIILIVGFIVLKMKKSDASGTAT